MRQILKTLYLVFIAATLHAQTPMNFHYQALVRDATGSPIVSKNVSFRINILNTAAGASFYTETHAVTTNEFGFVNLTIGSGRINGSSTLKDIPWDAVKPFLKVEIDLQGGENFELMGISQLLSVPYAFHANTADHAKTADNGFSGDYRDLRNVPDPSTFDNSATNEIQTLSTNGRTVTLSRGGGSFTMPPTYTAGTNINISNTNRISVTAPIRSVGDRVEGGIVFYTNTQGTHGLVLCIRPNGFPNLGNANWYNAHNSVKTPDLTGGEYTDWRMPSLAECRLIQLNLVNSGLLALDLEVWTDTETVAKADGFESLGNSAINFDFGPFNTIASNYTHQTPINQTLGIFAVRAF